MPLQSKEFILIFLPILILLTLFINQFKSSKFRSLFLILISIIFIILQDISALFFILISTLFNYSMGFKIYEYINKDYIKAASITLKFSVITNVLILLIFKYGSLGGELISFFGIESNFLNQIILPLAFSFYTFQQLTYLTDLKNKVVIKIPSLLNYILFIIYFPKILSGPILRYNEFLSQLNRLIAPYTSIKDLSIGLSIFIIGLFKKVVIADNISFIVNRVYDQPYLDDLNADVVITWCAILAFTFQVYFDFSGYSDMAIGISRMLGCKLPINFNSPLKSKYISGIWRNWHMTLTRATTDYLFTPLSIWGIRNSFSKFKGNNKFLLSTFVPTVFVFITIGIWHGNGWTFFLFGLIHSILVLLEKPYKQFLKRINMSALTELFLNRFITFVLFSLTLILFRANNLNQSYAIVTNLIPNFSLFSLSDFFNSIYINKFILARLVFLYFFVLIAPNTQELMKNYNPFLLVNNQNISSGKIKFKINNFWSFYIGFLFIISIISMGESTEFIYLQF